MQVQSAASKAVTPAVAVAVAKGRSERVGNWDVACGGVTRTAFLTEKLKACVRVRWWWTYPLGGNVKTGSGQGRVISMPG